MIVKTRYRDIPWEEARKCTTPHNRTDSKRSFWEERLRGQPVSIITPPYTYPSEYHGCNGPWYLTVDDGRCGESACVHIAEIGD